MLWCELCGLRVCACARMLTCLCLCAGISLLRAQTNHHIKGVQQVHLAASDAATGQVQPCGCGCATTAPVPPFPATLMPPFPAAASAPPLHPHVCLGLKRGTQLPQHNVRLLCYILFLFELQQLNLDELLI